MCEEFLPASVSAHSKCWFFEGKQGRSSRDNPGFRGNVKEGVQSRIPNLEPIREQFMALYVKASLKHKFRRLSQTIVWRMVDRERHASPRRVCPASLASGGTPAVASERQS